MDREAVEAFLNKINPKKMETAFKLVCPRTLAERSLAEGKITKAALDQITWKDEIDVVLSDAQLNEAGVTLAEVEDAIIYFTGESPTILSCKLTSTYHVTGCGYRMGGCGDH